jgi:hypothetical protein
MDKTPDYLTHEALHMAAFLTEAVDEQLLGHKAIEDNPDWKALAQAAFNSLFALHQAIGAKHLG